MSKCRNSKLITVILLTASILFTGNALAAVNKTFTISKKIEISDKRILTLTFKGLIFGETATGGYRNIEVHEGNKKHIQTINIAEVNSFGDETTTSPEPGTGSDIIIEDMDFDGINDFRIIAMLPPGPNIPYICFLWDKKSGKFVHAEFLDDITSPEFDSKTKTVTSSSRESANKYRKDVYKYSGGKLVLVKSVVKTYQ
ncbi:MAG TPA: hypothetical protein DD735_06710 [Clostridiales bacterium]|jgi:hypothetical protein|uniref:XAC2610-related protein n=1 Tax=Synergistaceae TaxID=649777 RepID=UPI000E8BD467|nr:hypothetical protein [Synergistaceae bacterium DZ-S4]HAH68687.1 hypothetical protein [Synergistaceae bacterium]HBR08570.1 hypothetical protein [Clostridiales bacterium]